MTETPLPPETLAVLATLSGERPLVVFDLETTGADRLTDRIVEIAALRFGPGGAVATFETRVNPGVKIPRESTRIHGIGDADVAGAPAFPEIAGRILEFFADADLAGYNVRSFDVPVLLREFALADLLFPLEGRRIVDMQTIYFKKEPRDLAAAVRFFAGREHTDAHSALADVLASAEVLAGQLKRYTDLPRDVAALHEISRPPEGRFADPDKRFLWRDGEIVFAFSEHRGKTLEEVAEKYPGFLDWMISKSFSEESKQIARDALRGVFPKKP
ncbi:MAG: exonuclease domain-containing protein [Thermoanaerobaculia bacterium]